MKGEDLPCEGSTETLVLDHRDAFNATTLHVTSQPVDWELLGLQAMGQSSTRLLSPMVP